MLLKIVLKVAVNAAAIYIASVLFSSVHLEVEHFSDMRSLGILALVGAVLWAGNALVRPIVKVLTFPLILVTLGLFNIVINLAILWGVDFILPQLEITGFLPLLWTTIIVSVINGLLFFL